MNNQLKIELLNLLAKHKIIPEIHRRNEEIRAKFFTLKRKGFKAKDAIWQLTDEYFLSYKNIERILYKKSKKFLC